MEFIDKTKLNHKIEEYEAYIEIEAMTRGLNFEAVVLSKINFYKSIKGFEMAAMFEKCYKDMQNYYKIDCLEDEIKKHNEIKPATSHEAHKYLLIDNIMYLKEELKQLTSKRVYTIEERIKKYVDYGEIKHNLNCKMIEYKALLSK